MAIVLKGLPKTRSYMIEPSDLNSILDDMDEFCMYRRKTIDESCLSKQMKTEHDRYWDGYEQAMKDFIDRVNKLKER